VNGEGESASRSPTAPFYGDVNGDSAITPADVLMLINWLNANHAGSVVGEGEAAEVPGALTIVADPMPSSGGAFSLITLPAVGPMPWTPREDDGVASDPWTQPAAGEATAGRLGGDSETRSDLFARWGVEQDLPDRGVEMSGLDLQLEEALLALVARDVAGIGPA
jgi:hypothetical protein